MGPTQQEAVPGVGVGGREEVDQVTEARVTCVDVDGKGWIWNMFGQESQYVGFGKGCWRKRRIKNNPGFAELLHAPRQGGLWKDRLGTPEVCLTESR